MDAQSSEINFLVVGGTMIMVFLLFFIAVSIILSQRRNARHKLNLHGLEMEKQRELLEVIITTQEKERQYFAQELHDSIGQMLAAVKLNIGNIKRTVEHNAGQLPALIEDTLNVVSLSIQEARAISHKLLPGVLLDFGLQEALQQLCEQLSSSGLQASCTYDDTIQGLEQQHELAIYRISQELMNNTVKYAEADKISIELKKEGERIIYTYTDNGKGFDPEAIVKKGLGMRNIESRVSMLNGKMKFQSSPGKGLILNIEIAAVKV